MKKAVPAVFPAGTVLLYYLLRSLASGGRTTFMAPLGQNSWQQKQRMQSLRSIFGLPRRIPMALAGQTWAHFWQPMHSGLHTCGREAM